MHTTLCVHISATTHAKCTRQTPGCGVNLRDTWRMRVPAVPSIPALSVKQTVALGSISMAVIAFTASMRGWPFPSLTAQPWLFQINGSNATLRYAFLVLFVLGCATLCVTWIRLLQLARAGILTMKATMWTFALWSLILLFATPLFSGDVYVYFLDGEVMVRGFDPYVAGVSAMGPVPDVHMVHPLWRDTNTMYGPVFMRLAQGIALLTNGNLIAGVIILRVIAIASIALAAISLKVLAERFDRPAVLGVVFGILNPVTMLHLIGGAHNDATMVGLLAAGLALGYTSNRISLRILALALCAAAAAFKIPAFAGALVLGWSWAGVYASRFRRVIYAGIAGVAALALFEIQTLATGMGWGWLNASHVPGLAHPLLSIPNAIALSFGGLVGEGYPLNDITRPLALFSSAAVAVWLILRTGANAEPYKVVRAFGWALLIISWTGPAVYPWYLAWGIAIVGAMGASKMEKPLIALTCALIFVVAPGGYGVLDIPTGSWRVVMAFLTLGVMVWGACDAYKRNHVPQGQRLLQPQDGHSSVTKAPAIG